jgi:hypothetical protein
MWSALNIPIPAIGATTTPVHSDHANRSDFCFANICNGQPTFPRMDSVSSEFHLDEFPLGSSRLNAEDTFGTESPLISVINSIRRLSRDLDPEYVGNVDRVKASSMIYNLEYDLLACTYR